MTDYLQRAITDSGQFFVFACDTTQLVATACRRHDVGPTAAAALGRAVDRRRAAGRPRSRTSRA